MNLTEKELIDSFKDQNIAIDSHKQGNTLFGSKDHVSIRKHRVAYKNVGARKGLRVISIVFVQYPETIVILHAYSKNEKKDLTNKESKRLREILNSTK